MGFLAGFVVAHPPLAVDGIGGNRDRYFIPETMASYERVAKEIAALKPDTIIVTSPHATLYSNYFHISPGMSAKGDFGAFGQPGIGMEATYDEKLVQSIELFCSEAAFPAGTKGEIEPALDHGTMVPLYFVNNYYTDYDLVRIGLSGLSLDDHFSFGKFIDKCVSVSDKRVVFLASGDLSHCQKNEGPYGFKPEGPEYDKKLMDTLKEGDLSKLLNFRARFLEEAQECGHRSFTIMAGAFDKKDYEIEVLSHEATFGVGYGFAIVRIKE